MLERSKETSISEADRYRVLLGAITDYAIYMLDAGGFVTSWNPGAQRFKGYAEAEILGHHVSHFYTEADRAAGIPEKALTTAAAEGRYEHEGWRVRKDGTRFWAHVVIDAIRDERGRPVGFAKVTRDLTERRAAEEALNQSREQFRRLVMGVTDYAIYMLDPDGLVTSWNAGAERIKGYTEPEIVGQHFSLFYTPEDRAQGGPSRTLDIARRDGRYEKEGWRVRKNGTRFFAHVVVDAIHDPDGTPLGFAKITRDITNQVRQRQELERAREQLFQAQKLEAIGQLTGGVAHDFNNLLMAVMGSLELLERRLPDDLQVRRLLNNAMEGARRGATLTKRMLAYARRQNLQEQAIDVAALVAGVQDLLVRAAGPEVLIERDTPPGLPKIRSDAVQLETALVNLIANARDAMPAGGRVRISADVRTRGIVSDGLMPGDYVCLAVTDTGEGMDPATLARAAEPFFTTKGIGKGTGLGLSMVQGLAQQSGGQLLLSSRRGEGTRVELWLPLARHLAPPDVRAREVPSAPVESAVPKALTILAVDDDPLVLMNTVAMLEDMGHVVIDAMSGAEALTKLHGAAIDLMITDQAMPGMSGSELARQVHELRPGLPVILATGYAELPPSGNAALPRLPKPFSQAELERAVSHFGLSGAQSLG